MALRRQVKNVVRNFSDIEVKVREATSNDPWGPSSSLTSEIADATYNNQAFTKIMTLLWKRMNDHGKNWRHVYKSLVVLDYIVKTGSDRVAAQCRENIFAIKTLKDFQFIDKDGKDQGQNVREKSKQLVALLKDEERLKNERQRALKAKERFSRSQGGIGNTSFPKNKKFQGPLKYPEARTSVDDTNVPSKNWQDHDKSDTRSTDGRIDSELEKVRPSNEVEEEMQLQIALAMSREEAEKEGTASGEEIPELQGSLINADTSPQPNGANFDPWAQPNVPNQLYGAAHQPITQQLSDPWQSANNQPVSSIGLMNQPVVSSVGAMNPPPQADPWGTPPKTQDPWGTVAPEPKQPDPWSTSGDMSAISNKQLNSDPFAPQDPLAGFTSQSTIPSSLSPASTFPSTNTGSLLDPSPSLAPLSLESVEQPTSKSSFLSNGAHLVDIDNILKEPEKKQGISNPFSMSGSTNPFQQDKPKPKSINEIRHEQTGLFAQPSGDVLLPTPMQPANHPAQQSSYNPFL